MFIVKADFIYEVVSRVTEDDFANTTLELNAPKIALEHITDRRGFLKLENFTILPAGEDAAMDLACLKVSRFIASGSFGSCIECKGPSGRSYAAKVIALPKELMQHYDARKMSQQEIDICTGPRFLNLPKGSNIVRMLGYGSLPANLGSKLGLSVGSTLIYEWCNAGDLDNALDGLLRTRCFLPEGLIWKWLVEVVSASHHMTKMCIINKKTYPVVLHDDISLSNIFLAYPEDDPKGRKSWPSIRLGDFGLGKMMGHYDDEIQTGTIRALYAAPSWPRKTVKSELWSFVHLIYLMCTRLCPAKPRDKVHRNKPGNPLDNGLQYSNEMLETYNTKVKVWRIPAVYSDTLQKFFEYVLVEDSYVQPSPLEAWNRLAQLQAFPRAARFKPVPAGIFKDYAQRTKA